jgi:hypothetical protein
VSLSPGLLPDPARASLPRVATGSTRVGRSSGLGGQGQRTPVGANQVRSGVATCVRQNAHVGDLAIYCADIGSIPNANFGWARGGVSSGGPEEHDGDSGAIGDLVEAVARDLGDQRRVALGFECPLFVPVPHDPIRLGRARLGEGSRPWSAGAGSGAMATGVVQVAWVLARLRERCPTERLFLDWTSFQAADTSLFLWEAFVSAEAKGTSHVGDATIAVECFADALPDPTTGNALAAELPLSLVGAAALWSGWSRDATLLHAPCLVLRAAAPSG